MVTKRPFYVITLKATHEIADGKSTAGNIIARKTVFG